MGNEKLNNLFFLRVALPFGPSHVGCGILPSGQRPILSLKCHVLCIFVVFKHQTKSVTFICRLMHSII